MRGHVIRLKENEGEERSDFGLMERKITFMVNEETICVSLRQKGWVLGWCERAKKETKDFIQDVILGEVAIREARGEACICLKVSLKEEEVIEMFERAGCEVIRERNCPKQRKFCHQIVMMAE